MIKQAIKEFLNSLRNFLLFKVRYRHVKIGRHNHCQWSTKFGAPSLHIVLGDYVGIGAYCLFQANTEIGRKVMIACNVAFLNRDEHNYDVVGKTMWDSGKGQRHKIIVEDDVWIGHGAILLTPLRIGHGAIIASGSVVVNDVPPYAIVGGNPGKVLKMRFTPEQIQEQDRLLYQ